MFNPLARRNRATHPATMVGAIALVLVVLQGSLAAQQLYREHGVTAEVAEDAAVLVTLANMAGSVSGAQRDMLLAQGDVVTDLASATNAIQVIEATHLKWEQLRGVPGLDPDTVARIDAFYAEDHATADAAVMADPAALALSIRAFGAVMEPLRADLGALTRETAAHQQTRLRRVAVMMGAVTALAITGFATTIAILGVATWRATVTERRRNRRELRTTRKGDLEARVKRALSMLDREEDAVDVMLRASAERCDGEVTAMMADSSRAHFHRSGKAAATCSVDSPVNCPAARQGHSLTFPSSDSLDACPHLGRNGGAPCGAVCVPMAVEGQTIGVLHHSRAVGEVPVSLAGDLELVASETSQRIGMLRALRTSRTQASTDLLTGLPNRRHIEDHVRSMRAEGVQPSVVYADLDHFKQLNDRFGHEAGDRALALFARVCSEAMRGSDVVARFGGEEFVIVLPGGSAEDALVVLERIRSRLIEATTVAGLPSFTASFGLALPQPGEAFDALLRRADAALLLAKDRGRDRIVIAEEHEVASAGPGEPSANVEPGPDDPRLDLRIPADSTGLRS